MGDYQTIAYNAAKIQGLTSGQVTALGYSGIATLAGVTIGPKGESAPDFFYVAIRMWLAARLRCEAEDVRRVVALNQIKTWVRLMAGWGEATVELDDRKRYVIDLKGGELQGIG